MRLGFTLILLTSLVVGSLAVAQAPAGDASKTPAASKPAAANKPLWKELSPAEQTALRPLSANWDSMGIGQKRKWQSVAKDFDKLPAAQQTKMHARMTEWTALSPKQRADARINFAEHRQLTDGLTPEQRKAQWQAYQQLSPEEKRKLAESASKPAIVGAAPAAKPQPVLKKEPAPEFGTAKVLANAKAAPSPAPGKKIAVAPHVANQGSILPGHAHDAAEKQ
jgi:Protein of unknown function (DUF3106)